MVGKLSVVVVGGVLGRKLSRTPGLVGLRCLPGRRPRIENAPSKRGNKKNNNTGTHDRTTREVR